MGTAEDAIPPGIWEPSVRRYFAEHIPGVTASDQLRFERIPGGRSNLTYRVYGSAQQWILRRPPLGHVLPTAHDMTREYRVLSALEDSAVPVPTVFPCK